MRDAICRSLLFMAAMSACTFGGCGRGASPSAPPGANVVADTGRRVTATIGPQGGSVTASGSDGVVYRLDVPAHALPALVEIAMTPIRTISSLPYSGGLAAAVQLEPSGLVLVVPALLTIATTADLTGDQRLVGFNFQGDADAFVPTAAIDGAGGLRVPVPHFSGAGAAAAQPGDPGYDYCADPDIALRIMCIAQADPDRRDKFLAAAREYLNDIVMPGVRGDSGLELRDAVIDLYLRWYEIVDGFAAEYQAGDWLEMLAADHDATLDLVAARLREEIAGSKEDLCAGHAGLEALISIFEWNWLASTTGVDTPEDGLTEEQTLDGLCAAVVIESFELPDPMPVGEDVSVDIALRLDLNGVAVAVPMQVNLFGNLDFGSQFERCCGRTNAAGEFTTVARRVQDGSIVLELTAFPVLPLFSPERGLTLASVPVYGRASLFLGSVHATAAFPAAVTPGVPTALHLLVQREVAVGAYGPVSGGIVTCSVSGGSADPAIAVTDVDGLAHTMITADAGVDSVFVDFVVETDGVEIARDRVRALASSDVGVISLFERYSEAAANIPNNGNCPAESDADANSSPGAATVSAGSSQSCFFEDPDTGYVESVSASSFISQTSDTGIAADGRSAVMMFSASGSANAVGENSAAEAHSHTSFSVYFEVQGGPMTFQLDGSFEATGNGSIVVTLQTEQYDILYEWDKGVGDGTPSTILVTGNLPPGRYRGSVNLGGGANYFSPWPAATYGGQVTLTLGQATTAKSVAASMAAVDRLPRAGTGH